MQKMNTRTKNNKGFTMIEFMIFMMMVIFLAFIFAIGFNILTPSTSVYIETEETKVMSKTVQDYMDQHQIDHLTAPEIRALIQKYHTYDLSRVTYQELPKALWFHIPTKTFILTSKYEDLLDEDKISLVEALRHQKRFNLPFVSDPINIEPGHQLEELISGFILVSMDGSNLERALYQIRNLRTQSDYFQRVSVRDSIFISLGLDQHIKKFAFEHTLYINDFQSITMAHVTRTLNHIIFADHIETIHAQAFDQVRTFLPETIRLPLTIKVIETSAFYDVYPYVFITHDFIDLLHVETNAFHPNDTYNASLKLKESLFELKDVTIEYFDANYAIYYYQDVLIGKKLFYDHGVIDYYNAFEELVGTKIGNFYFDALGHLVVQGDVYDDLVLLDTEFDNAITIEKKFYDSVSLSIRGDYLDVINDFYHYVYSIHETSNLKIIEAKIYNQDMVLIAKGQLFVQTRIYRYLPFQQS
jgi:competence protein ComGC